MAALLGYAAQGYSAMASGGLLVGLILWLLGPPTLGPLLEGRGPTWSLGEASAAFSGLIADLLCTGPSPRSSSMRSWPSAAAATRRLRGAGRPSARASGW